jgi:KDO2-lipid IV(A) lauroyltransferase
MTGKPPKAAWLQLVEYAAARAALSVSRLIPLRVAYRLSLLVGDLVYLVVPRRRRLALGNVAAAFAGALDDVAVRRVARESCRSLVLTVFESLMLPRLVRAAGAGERLGAGDGALGALFEKAARLHEQSGGCIFVTPHLGNWELLPAVSAAAGIPLVIVARPLANRHLERLFYRSRVASGQLVVPKKNSLLLLQRTLQRGRSIGLLADQATVKGLSVEFFGRSATTTPVPALLAVTKNRPVVVVACCRTGYLRYAGYVFDPIVPDPAASEKEELFRITREMNAAMEAVIRRHPEQYLWMHDRWKTYEGRAALIEEQPRSMAATEGGGR